MNKYKNPNSTTVGVSGCMVNENMRTEKQINYNHYGIFANDNTYAITFNPYINRPPTKQMTHYPIKPPPTNQHITRTYNEPPVSLTDGKTYLNNAASNAPPILPPFLNKPEDLATIQGLADEKNKGTIQYGPTHTINQTNIVY